MSTKRSHAAGDFTRGIELVKQQTRTQMRSIFTYILILLVTGIGFWFVYILAFSSFAEIDGWLKWSLAWLNVHAFNRPGAIIRIATSGGLEGWPSAAVLNSPWFQSIQNTVSARVGHATLFATSLTVAVGVLGVFALRQRGRDAHDDEIVRGPKTVPGKELARVIRKKGIASRLIVGEVPLIESAETAHTLIMGTTGVGKSQALFRMMDAIAHAGQAAIVYDRTGQMVEKFYDRRRGDIILNPFDERSPPWSPWGEIRSIADPERLSAAFIPPGKGDGAFFNEAARALLTALFMRIGRQADRSVLKLLQAALQWPIDVKRELLRGTEAAKFYKEDSRAGHDIDMIMSTYTRSLRYLPVASGTDADFSIRAFVEQLDGFASRKPWLFFAGKAEDMDAIRPLLTCWIDVVCAAIMGSGERLDRRIWILLDEWQTLQEVPKLHDILAEGRKYGAAVVAGNQNLKQLEDIYGKSKAATMLSLFNTKVIFRTPEPESAEWCESQLGKSVWERPQESVRIATASVMDGITLQTQRQQEAIVLASEIVALPTLECYVQLPGEFPVAHTKLPNPRRFRRPTRAPRLVERPLSETVFEALNQDAPFESEGAAGSRTALGVPHQAAQPPQAAPKPTPVREERQGTLLLDDLLQPTTPENGIERG